MRGPGWVLQLVSTTWTWEAGGELHYMEVRHAGDTPLEGLV